MPGMVHGREDGVAAGSSITGPLDSYAPPGPTTRAPLRVVVGMALAQFGLFVALLAPVTVSLALKTQTLVAGDRAAVVNGKILAVAAFFALVANPVFGRFSDLTTARFGRRRTWMAIGVVLFVLAQALVAVAPAVPLLAVGWCLSQIAGNAVLAPLMATIADQVPHEQRGSVSANVGVMQNVGILGGAYLASLFVTDMLALFLVPSAIAVALVGLYCLLLPDRPIAERPQTEGWLAMLRTFWVNPLHHPDFGWAWACRFLVTLASFLFVTYRIFFLQRQVGLTAAEAARALTIGVLLYTLALVITAKIGGFLSDRFDRRKVFVITSTLIGGTGLVLLAKTHSLPVFYTVEVVMGIGYGVYAAVDTALVIDVLPNPDDSAKDLGVLNIANALPQSLAPLVGLILLGLGGVAGANYPAMFIGAGVIALLGALAVVPIKKVR
jgi:MFS family permease